MLIKKNYDMVIEIDVILINYILLISFYWNDYGKSIGNYW